MSREFEEDLDGASMRRPGKELRASAPDGGSELKVMGDSRVHPLPNRKSRPAAGENRLSVPVSRESVSKASPEGIKAASVQKSEMSESARPMTTSRSEGVARSGAMARSESAGAARPASITKTGLSGTAQKKESAGASRSAVSRKQEPAGASRAAVQKQEPTAARKPEPSDVSKPVTAKSETTGVSRAAKAGAVSSASSSAPVSRGKRSPGTDDAGKAAARETAASAEKAEKNIGTSVRGLSLRQERELGKKKRRRRIIAMIVAEVIALACIFGYGYFLRQWNQIQRPEFDEVAIKNNDLDMNTVERMKGYWTIAIFGVDARGKELTKSTNADVNLICNINLDSGEIKLVSVFRDSYLNISKNGTYNKINQAYFLGGPEQAVAALNRNLDLNITDYMTFNWKAVADAINVLGGVDVEISKAEFYYINSFITETVKVTGVGSHQLTSAGMNHLDGVQAVAYGRLRLMDTDYARTERQRKIIKLAFEKAKKADVETLNRVLGTVFPQVATSINVNDIFNSLKIINRYHLGETTGFPQARGDANMGKKGACVIPQTLESNVVKLHEFLFGETEYTPSETLKKISAKISADSGMYREGKYVESVGTGGGVIQTAKESKAAQAEQAANAKKGDNGNSDSKFAVIYVLDKDGNKVKKTIELETNADGEYIQPQVYSNGIAKGWSLNGDGKLVEKETDASGKVVSSSLDLQKPTPAPETDAQGNLILRGETDASGNGMIRPTEAQTDAYGRPISTQDSGNGNLRPGYLDNDELGTGNMSNNTAPTAGTSLPNSAYTNPTGSQNSGVNYTPPKSVYTNPTGAQNAGTSYTPPTSVYTNPTGTQGTGAGSSVPTAANPSPGGNSGNSLPGGSTGNIGSTSPGGSTGNIGSTSPGGSAGNIGNTFPGGNTGKTESTSPGGSTNNTGSTSPGGSIGNSGNSGSGVTPTPGSTGTSGTGAGFAPGGAPTPQSGGTGAGSNVSSGPSAGMPGSNSGTGSGVVAGPGM